MFTLHKNNSGCKCNPRTCFQKLKIVKLTGKIYPEKSFLKNMGSLVSKLGIQLTLEVSVLLGKFILNFSKSVRFHSNVIPGTQLTQVDKV